MKTILKKNKYLTFLIALAASIVSFVAIACISKVFIKEYNVYLTLLIPVASGFISSKTLSYHKYFSLKFSLLYPILIFFIPPTILLFLSYNAYVLIFFIYAIPICLPLVSFGAFIGYVVCEKKQKHFSIHH